MRFATASEMRVELLSPAEDQSDASLRELIARWSSWLQMTDANADWSSERHLQHVTCESPQADL
jgi:hypothetical protein